MAMGSVWACLANFSVSAIVGYFHAEPQLYYAQRPKTQLTSSGRMTMDPCHPLALPFPCCLFAFCRRLILLQRSFCKQKSIKAQALEWCTTIRRRPNIPACFLSALAAFWLRAHTPPPQTQNPLANNSPVACRRDQCRLRHKPGNALESKEQVERPTGMQGQ